MSQGKGRLKALAYGLILLMLGASVGALGTYAALPTQDGTADGSGWLRWLNLWVSNSTVFDFLTPGRIPYTAADGTIDDDAGLTYNSATNTATVEDINATNSTTTTDLYANAELWIQGENRTDPTLYPEKGADYIIFTDGLGNYYAENGHNGTIKQGTIFADIWQDCHDALPYGGEIFLSTGLFTLTKTLNMTYDGIFFTGSTMWRGTTLSSEAQTNGIKLSNNINKDMIYVSGVKCRISNIYLDGNLANNAAGDGIDTAPTSNLDLHMDHVYIFFAKENGLFLRGGAGNFNSVYIEYCGLDGFVQIGTGSSAGRNTFSACSSWGNLGDGWNVTNLAVGSAFSACVSAVNEGNGVVMGAGYGTSWTGGFIQENKLNGMVLVGVQNGVISDVLFTGNGQAATNTYSQLSLTSSGSTHTKYNVFSNLIMYSVKAKVPKYNIDFTTSSQITNIVTSCYLANAGTAQIHETGGANKIHGNYGWVTENSGTATISSGTTSKAFAHGFSTTPSASWFSIIFTENPTNPTGNWWLTVNATHAVLHVSADPGASNLDFGWCALRP